VVRVPVFVTDGSGHPVEGLIAEDFELREDGRRRAVVGFRTVDAARPGEELAGPEALLARRQFLLLFDLCFSNLPGLVRAREAATTFVRSRLGPADLAAVASYSSQSGVRLLVGFTSDRPQLERAIASLGLARREPGDPLGLTFEEGAPPGGPGGPTQTSGEPRVLADLVRAQRLALERSEAAHYRQQVVTLLDGLGQLSRLLDSVRGRKHVLYFSSGFSTSTVMGVDGQRAREASEAVVEGRLWEVESDAYFGDASIRDQVRRALGELQISDVVIDCVDLAGLAASADGSTFGRGPSGDPGRGSLAMLADVSGGRLIKNTNDLLIGLDEILESTRRYYLLAFEPGSGSTPRPGKEHRIEVKVHGRGHQVSYRSRYRVPEPYPSRPDLAKRLEAADVIAKGMNGGPLSMEVLAVPYRDPSGRITLPVLAQVAARPLLEGGKRGSLDLEVYAYLLSDAGRVEDSVALAASIDLARWGDLLASGGLEIQTAFALPAGDHSLRLLVRDAGSGRMGARTVAVQAPAFDRGDLVLYPPLFMESAEGRLMLGTPSRSLPDPASPFSVSGSGFVPRLEPRLSRGETRSVCVMAFAGGRPADDERRASVTAQLLDAQGEPVPAVALKQVSRSFDVDGFQRIVFDLESGELAPGAYAVRVRVTDPTSGQTREASQAVSVEAR